MPRHRVIPDVGPDPKVWLERLLEINEGSSFGPLQMEIIRAGLTEIIKLLGELGDGA